MSVHHLSRADARRIAVQAQLLTADRPTDLLDVVRHLTVLQHDPTTYVAQNADLVVWSRLGSVYDPADLAEALESGSLVDLHMMLRPAEHIALFTAEMAAWPGVGDLREWQVECEAWVEANEACRLDILDRLGSDGPLAARELPDTCELPWRSSGWTNNKNVQRLLGFMVARGEVASAGRRGRERLWDLAERIYPDDPMVPLEEAGRLRDQNRLHALGIARAKSAECPGEPNDVGEAGEPAVVEGVKGEWRVDPAYLGRPFSGRAALLSPLDRLVYDRKRAEELFEFDYQLEMYKPVDKRRWGYWAMPILYGDRLVGKLDAAADLKAGVLRVDAIHEDEPFDRKTASSVQREIDDLALWLGLELSVASTA